MVRAAITESSAGCVDYATDLLSADQIVGALCLSAPTSQCRHLVQVLLSNDPVAKAITLRFAANIPALYSLPALHKESLSVAHPYLCRISDHLHFHDPTVQLAALLLVVKVTTVRPSIVRENADAIFQIVKGTPVRHPSPPTDTKASRFSRSSSNKH